MALIDEKPKDAAYTIRPSRVVTHGGFLLALNALMVAAALCGIASLLLEYGFHELPEPLSLMLLHWVQAAAAVALGLDRLIRPVLAVRRRDYLQEHWGGLVLLALAVAAVVIAPLYREHLVGTPIRIAVVQIYIVLMLLLRGVDLNIYAANSGIPPSRLLIGSFVFLVLVGTGLLMLPRAVAEGRAPLFFEDAFFTATSATCVTGLIVLDTGSHFSLFGQVVILSLIQIGGLGIMIFGTVFAIVSGRMNLRQSAVMGEMVSTRGVGQISRTVQFIVASTLIIEAIGAILLYPVWADRPRGVFHAVFHSISAFCNAGFSLERQSMVLLRNQWQIISIMPLLIILGGLGFPVLYDLVAKLPRMAEFYRRRGRRNPGMPRPKLMLQTKVVLAMSLLLLLLGMGVLLAVEPQPGVPAAQLERDRPLDPAEREARLTDWQQVRGVNRVWQAWFQSMTARTAGFNTINIDEFSNAGKLWIILLMLIGGSPASTAGGMKTVTFAVLIMLVWSILRRRQNVEVFRRTVAEELVRRAIVVAGLFLTLVFVTTLLLAVAQPSSRMIDVLFEAASACGTVGLSTGETARLTLMGKYVIIGAMFVGRVGPLTLLASLVIREMSGRYSYPSENLVMG